MRTLRAARKCRCCSRHRRRPRPSVPLESSASTRPLLHAARIARAARRHVHAHEEFRVQSSELWAPRGRLMCDKHVCLEKSCGRSFVFGLLLRAPSTVESMPASEVKTGRGWTTASSGVWLAHVHEKSRQSSWEGGHFPHRRHRLSPPVHESETVTLSCICAGASHRTASRILPSPSLLLAAVAAAAARL